MRSIGALRPDLHAFSNEEMVARFQQVGFSYFRQISAVLSSITLFFGFLLITVLLTVSVNQRFAEIAALRALGFTRRRVVLDVLAQAVLLVGYGRPALAAPGPRPVALAGVDPARHAGDSRRACTSSSSSRGPSSCTPRCSRVTAVLAALYPMRLVARLPIAATLRSEMVT